MKKIAGMLGLFLAVVVLASGCTKGKVSPEANLEMGVAGLASLTDSHIKDSLTMLEVLAATQEVQSGDWEKMLPVLTKADEVMVPGPTWFGLPDGSYSVVGTGKTDKNIADRAYFSVVMSGKNTYSELVVSRSTGEKALVVAVPVIRAGKVIGILGSSVFLEDLSDMLSKEVKLADNMVFYAVTAENQVALHSEKEMILGEKLEPLKNSASVTAPFTGWRITLGYK
jgi:methyl-accepting chemotaxis protein